MKLGLALAGGGIRGIAHAGVLQAFEENNIKIDIIGGTSSGSLIAVLYAMGFSGSEILYLFKKYSEDIIGASSIPIISNFNNNFSNSGIKTGEEIEKVYNQVAKEKGISKMSDIKMPIVIPTTNFVDSKEYIFTSILPNVEEKEKYITDSEVGVAVRASSSFSGVFQPCFYKDKIFLDGGILDNVPVKIMKNYEVEKIIAINFISDSIDRNSNMVDIIMKTLDIMGNKISEDSLNIADLIITVPTDRTGLLELDKIEYCYNSGYEKAMEYIDKVKQLIL